MSSTKDSETIRKIVASHFDCVGFATPQLPDAYLARLRTWIDQKYHGSMAYMERTLERRLDTRLVLPDVASVIVVALNYFPGNHVDAQKQDEDISLAKIHESMVMRKSTSVEQLKSLNRTAHPKPLNHPAPHNHPSDSSNHSYKVARYAWGDDYHTVFEDKFAACLEACREITPDASFKPYVDYGPMLERAFAEQAGIGFIGKNGLIITKEFGSWVFLGTIVTDLELTPDTPATRMCGTCKRCIDICPTQAIVEEGMVDARRCISYQTIENKTDFIPSEISDKSGKWIFGCDKCQEVCPHNCRTKMTETEAFQKHCSSHSVKNSSNDSSKTNIGNGIHGGFIDGDDILNMDEEQFSIVFRNSPLKRGKLTGLKRNIEAQKKRNSIEL